MATSVVNHVIEPAKPMFGVGELVVIENGTVVMVGGSSGKETYYGYHISGTYVGSAHTYYRSDAKPFKGSVTLTEA